jgi:gliding motility-associated-like protein
VETGRLHFDWKFADNTAFVNADHSREREFSRRIEGRGTYYAQLTITDLDTDSVTLYEGIQITLSESRLAVPNTFTPNGDGVHDMLKVSYESLVKFQAIIFNRWGQRLYSWTNPDEGWDGADQPVGVYYIVVEAKGGDGINYSFRQAVNLLK